MCGRDQAVGENLKVFSNICKPLAAAARYNLMTPQLRRDFSTRRESSTVGEVFARPSFLGTNRAMAIVTSGDFVTLASFYRNRTS